MQFEKSFIAATKEYSDYYRNVPAPYIRGTFTLEGMPKKSEIVITALGFYDLYINGRRITKGILAPYICNPEQVVVYDSYWAETIHAATPTGRCVMADFEPIREHKKRKAVRIIPLKDGYLYDFGVNTAGNPVLKIDGKAGQKVTLVCGEWFKDGDMDTKNIQC